MDKNIDQKNIISIIIATKNGGHFLSRSIASIEKQIEKNIEVIIISDGSTDDTATVAQDLATTRPFIKVINLERNVGPGLARNAGIKEAAGEYISILDDDDEWMDENKLGNQKSFLDKNKDYVLVGAAETNFVTEDNKLLFVYEPKMADEDIHSKIILSNQFVTSSVMFRKSIFMKVGGFAPMYLAEDYDLWLRLTQVGKVANILGSKTRYYKRTQGAGQSNKRKMNIAVLKIVKQYRNSFPHRHLALLIAYLRILLP